jgi:hypothetical protein
LIRERLLLLVKSGGKVIICLRVALTGCSIANKICAVCAGLDGSDFDRNGLFDGMARYRNVQAARFKQDQVEQAGMKAEEDIQTGIKKLYEQLNMQIEQLDQLDKTLDFAKTYLESRDKAFREGLSTSTGLVDAYLLVSKVKIDRLQVFNQMMLRWKHCYRFAEETELFVRTWQRKYHHRKMLKLNKTIVI